MEPRTIEILEILAESTCLDSNWVFEGTTEEYFSLIAYGVVPTEVEC